MGRIPYSCDNCGKDFCETRSYLQLHNVKIGKLAIKCKDHTYVPKSQETPTLPKVLVDQQEDAKDASGTTKE